MFEHFLILLVTLLTFLFLYDKNKNLLSPTKIFFIFTVLFYFGFYFLEPNILTTSSLLSIFLALLIVGYVDSDQPINIDKLQFKVPVCKYWILLLLAFPALAVKVYDVHSVGGIEHYLYNLAFRVRDLSGQGWKVVLFASIQVIFVYSMYLFFIDRRKTFLKITIITSVFFILLFFSITSGSRSSLAVPIVTTLILYHSILKPIKTIYLVISGFLISSFVVIYGAVRNTFGTSSEVDFGNLELAQFYYGVNPLMIVHSSGESPLLFGQSYLSLFTNFIPRVFYPDKPDTGGLTFTKYYMDDQWEGLSNLAPGVFGEGIMNFGFSYGFIVGTLLLFLVFLLSVLIFRRALKSFSSNANPYKKGLNITLAIFFVLAAARFSYSEFTNVFFSFILFNLLPVVVVYILMLVRIGYRK